MAFFYIFRGYFEAGQPIILGHPQAAGVPESYHPESMYVVVFVPYTGDSFPQENKLFQNYPNPFVKSANTHTTIRYSILDASAVRLDICNIKGQTIYKLVDAVQSAGYYGIAWDGVNSNGQSAASGIYFCRLFVDNTEPIIMQLLLQK
jgi:hypothetical protein